MNVADAAASGDHLKLLIATRELIANTLANPECPIRDISPLTRRLQEVSEKISTLEERERMEGKPSDRTGRKGGGWNPAQAV